MTAQMWVVMNDFKSGRFIEEEYDRSAWSQIDGMVRDAMSKEMWRNNTAKIYDMILGRPD